MITICKYINGLTISKVKSLSKHYARFYINKQLQVIFLILFLTGCYATKHIVTGGDWTGYNYSYFCPSYRFSNTGTIQAKWDILNANNISLAEPNCNEAIKKTNEYIKAKGGMDFFNKLHLYDIDITYLDSASRFDNKRPLYNLDKCGDTKYYLRFLFSPDKNTNYRFGIALNNNYEVISKNVFPDYNTNPDFDKIIKPQEAYKIAFEKYKSLVNPLKSIELIYDERLNCFLWNIEREKEIKHNTYEYEIGFVKINADTKQIIDSGTYKGKMMIDHSF